MRKISLLVCLSFAFFAASAVAQMTPGGSQGTQESSPSAQQPSQYPQQQQPGMGQGTAPEQNSTQNQNGEHTLKGCVQSQGGSYVLETKKGKDIALTGQDISAHVGHEVAVKGTWAAGGGAMSSTSSSSAGSAEKTFNVTSVKHISDTCKSKSSSGNTGNSSNMGNGGNTSSPSGTGQSTQPPQ
jgi:Protein of unknown function (DUF5818)